MAQAFGVRPLECGPNRLAVLAIVRPLLSRPPAEVKAAITGGPPVEIAIDIDRDAAFGMAEELRQLGAKAEVFISIDDHC